MNVDPELLFHCFLHFSSLDYANASVHTADVKFSPITFRLAETLSADDYYYDHQEVATVMAHSGRYEEDKGR